MGQTNDTSSPWVHSVSYGDVEATIPIEYKTQVDMEFKKMGTLGKREAGPASASGQGKKRAEDGEGRQRRISLGHDYIQLNTTEFQWAPRGSFLLPSSRS
jgi:hypothetical protein